MLKLFKVSYTENYRPGNPIIKFIKARTRIEAINVGVTVLPNGEDQGVDSIKVECLCEVDEILNCTSAQGTKE